MIVKPYVERERTGDLFRDAGRDAERQMAHYLHRAFAQDSDLHILNDLRLVDPDQPEQDGAPGVAQIDHLVVHRWGLFIVESKSVSDAVTVHGDGAGGDEWTRVFRGRQTGMPSPIRQAERQGKFLREYLHSRRETLLGKVPLGLRPFTLVLHKTDQRGFRSMPIQIIVAVSDRGKIERKKWEPPSKPFRTFVCKADQVDAKIREEFEKHRSSSNVLSKGDGEYGIWGMKQEESAAVAQFLTNQHTPVTSKREEIPRPVERVAAPVAVAKPTVAQAVCRGCGGGNLSAHWGRGYYWKCGDCGVSTTIPVVCTGCGAKGERGKGVRVEKSRGTYTRVCEGCGVAEVVWEE